MDQRLFYEQAEEDSREKNYSSDKIRYIVGEVGNGKTVLDIGCNEGHLGSFLIPGNTVYGVDISPKALTLAKKQGLRATYHDIERKPLPYKKNFFDIVIIGDVIEHVFDTDTLLREARRVLKPGGKIIVTTPNVASLGRRVMLLAGVSPYLEFSSELTTNGLPSVGHIRYYTVNTLLEQLRHTGFTDIHFATDRVNLFFISSRFLGTLFPRLGINIFLTAIKNGTE